MVNEGIAQSAISAF